MDHIACPILSPVLPTMDRLKDTILQTKSDAMVYALKAAEILPMLEAYRAELERKFGKDFSAGEVEM